MPSADLRAADPQTVATLSAPGLLAIDQDPLGRPGRRVASNSIFEVWERPLEGGASAVAVVNRGDAPATVDLDWAPDHGAPPDAVDAWTGEPIETGSHLIVLEPHAAMLCRVARDAGQGGEPVVVTIAG